MRKEIKAATNFTRTNSKGFQIANEVLNQNNFLMEDTLDGINCSQGYGMNVDVAFAGEDKKLIIELFMSEFEKPILFM